VHDWRMDDLSEDHGRQLRRPCGRVRGQRQESIHVRVCPTPSMDWSYLAVALDTTQPLAQGSGQTVHYSHLRARALSRYLIQSRAARLVTRQSSPMHDGPARLVSRYNEFGVSSTGRGNNGATLSL